jgi:putative Ca2+/H+ antiporter (TMEM165/GDT1 family)
MKAFWLSLFMIFMAEMGDKTQLVALSLAAKFNAWVVLACSPRPFPFSWEAWPA